VVERGMLESMHVPFDHHVSEDAGTVPRLDLTVGVRWMSWMRTLDRREGQRLLQPDDRKPKNIWYACAAACQGNGATTGADYLVGWSNLNCADATLRAKASAASVGQTYPRHCRCVDTDGFMGTGDQCEKHTR